jgi:hypothetical protein
MKTLKNITYRLMLAAIAATMAVAFTACDKDESAPTPASLSGTTWQGPGIMKVTEGGNIVEEIEKLCTLTFSSTTVVYTIADPDGSKPSDMNGTYEYTKPLLTITILGTTLSGAVDGNKMTVRTSDGSTFALIKKN